MKSVTSLRKRTCVLRWVWLATVCWLALPAIAEDTFAVLQTKTATYRNVTVTTKAKGYIFIRHDAGMSSVKLAQLSPETRQQLGYVEEPSQKAKAGSLAKQARATLESPAVKAMEARIQETWRQNAPATLTIAQVTKPPVIAGVIGALLALHLLFSYCVLLICRKTAQPDGVLVWLPVLQIIPLLRAAGMSGAWFLAYFVPVLNFVAHVVWSVKIAKARGKSSFVSLLLILPLTNPLAFLYLAFAGVPPAPKRERKIEIMTLEAI